MGLGEHLSIVNLRKIRQLDSEHAIRIFKRTIEAEVVIDLYKNRVGCRKGDAEAQDVEYG